MVIDRSMCTARSYSKVIVYLVGFPLMLYGVLYPMRLDYQVKLLEQTVHVCCDDGPYWLI